MTKKHSRTIAFAGFGLVAAMGLTACGAETGSGANSSDPKGQIVSAFGQLADSNGVGMELTLDSSRADIEKINAALSEDERMNEEDVDLLVASLDGRIISSVSAAEGKTLGEEPDSFQMAVQLKDSSLVDVVATDGSLFLKLDADWVTREFDTDAQTIKEGFGDLDPSIVTPMNALLDSQWISFDLDKSMQAFEKEGLGQEAESLAPVDPVAAFSLFKSLESAFDEDVQVTAIDGGFRVVTPAKEIAAAVQDDLIALAGESEAPFIKEEIAALPDNDIAVDLFLDNGKLSGINLDLVQFLDEPVKDANLTLEMDLNQEVEAVKAPGSATEVDVAAIFQAFSE